jgi:ABC-type hemin transport system ATPase subunit
MVEIADRLLRLEDGRLVDAGKPEDVLSQGARDRAI